VFVASSCARRARWQCRFWRVSKLSKSSVHSRAFVNSMIISQPLHFRSFSRESALTCVHGGIARPAQYPKTIVHRIDTRTRKTRWTSAPGTGGSAGWGRSRVENVARGRHVPQPAARGQKPKRPINHWPLATLNRRVSEDETPRHLHSRTRMPQDSLSGRGKGARWSCRHARRLLSTRNPLRFCSACHSTTK